MAGDSQHCAACEAQTDEAFSRLQELVDALPAMEEKGRLLVRAKQAESVVRQAESFQTCKSLLGQADDRLAEARSALVQAEAVEEGVDEARRAVLHAASLRGFRVGPLQNAETMLCECLASSPFANLDEARLACMEKTVLAELEKEVSDYRESYAEALKLCESLV